MVVCRIDKAQRYLSFAGANNPLYLLREGEITEYKGDKMPVCIHEVMPPFTRGEIILKPADRIYLFSDGFADQFGGPLGKKYKYRPFKEFLASTGYDSIVEQGHLLEKEFEQWKGNQDQIDDVVILGLEF